MKLLELLSGVGDVLDTPGRFARTALAGRNPFSAVFDPSNGVSGRDLLQQYGLVGANQAGLDGGDIGGFLAEVALDPMNLIGTGLLAKVMGKASKAKAANKGIETANKLSLRQRLQGFMPEEIAKKTKIVDDFGRPRQVRVIPTQQFEDHLGGGVEHLTSSMKGKFVDSRNPLDVDSAYPRSPEEVSRLNEEANRLLSLSADSAKRELRLKPYWPDKAVFEMIGDRVDELRNMRNSKIPGETRLHDVVTRNGDWDGLPHDAVVSFRGDHPLVSGVSDADVYMPYIAKEIGKLQKIPNTKPLLLALLGQNVMARFGGQKH